MLLQVLLLKKKQFHTTLKLSLRIKKVDMLETIILQLNHKYNFPLVRKLYQDNLKEDN